MKVIWSFTASKSYRDNLIYLKEKWTIKEIEFFIDQVDKTIELIKLNPLIGKVSDVSSNYRQILVVKQITLYYRIASDHIRIVSFFNNFQDPDKLQEFLT